jgi:hypothetical protein
MLEKQHHGQFLTIHKRNQLEKLEWIYSVSETCKKLGFIIDFNMKNVDENIIPNLKEIVLKSNELKKHIAQLQSIQMGVIEQEDQLLNSLNALQMSFRQKIEKIYESEVIPVFHAIF